MINIIPTLISIVTSYFKDFFTFFGSMITLLPRMLLAIINNLPPFFQYSLSCFLYFIICVIVMKLIAIIWASVKG